MLTQVKRGALCPKNHDGLAFWSTAPQPFVEAFLSKAVHWSAGVGIPTVTSAQQLLADNVSDGGTIDSSAGLLV